jgi:hypothetical protein
MAKKNSNQNAQIIGKKFANLVLNDPEWSHTSMYGTICTALEKIGIRRNAVTEKTFVLNNFETMKSYLVRNGITSVATITFREKKVKYDKPKIPKTKTINKKPKYESNDDFLQSYSWRKLRMEALILHGRRCQCCGATPDTGAIMNVDHIKPRKTHPELSLVLENLQVLCHECNHGKGNWDTTDWRQPIA